MEYVVCRHRNKSIKEKKTVSTDGISTVKPEVFCLDCELYLSDLEKETRSLINIWFIRQDGNVQAVAS